MTTLVLANFLNHKFMAQHTDPKDPRGPIEPKSENTARERMLSAATPDMSEAYLQQLSSTMAKYLRDKKDPRGPIEPKNENPTQVIFQPRLMLNTASRLHSFISNISTGIA